MKKKIANYFAGKLLFVGIDVHKKRWVVTVRTYDIELCFNITRR